MIDFPFGQNISISVLLVFRLILFDLSHRTKRDQSLLISLLICFRDLLIRNMLVSSAKWWILLFLIETCKSLIKIRNNSGPKTEPCGTP